MKYRTLQSTNPIFLSAHANRIISNCRYKKTDRWQVAVNPKSTNFTRRQIAAVPRCGVRRKEKYKLHYSNPKNQTSPILKMPNQNSEAI